jgi:hypothetical protein
VISAAHEDHDEVSLQAACVDQSRDSLERWLTSPPAVRPRLSTFVAPTLKAEIGRFGWALCVSSLHREQKEPCYQRDRDPPVHYTHLSSVEPFYGCLATTSTGKHILFQTSNSCNRVLASRALSRPLHPIISVGVAPKDTGQDNPILGTLVKIRVEEVVITPDEDAEMMFGCIFCGWILCRGRGGEFVVIEL